MSAVVIVFPALGRPPRAAIEATIERLIEALDHEDAPGADMEPDEDSEDSDDAEAEA